MFTNIGGKIKGLAVALFVIEAVFLLWGVAMNLDDERYSWVARILALLSAPAIAWISSWILYAFGQLVENSDVIAKFVRNIAASARTASAPVEEADKDVVYAKAKVLMDMGKTISAYEAAIAELELIPAWRDSQELIVQCRNHIEAIKARQKKSMTVFLVAFIGSCALVTVVVFTTLLIIQMS